MSYGNALGQIMIAGIVAVMAVGFFVPPAVVAGIAWLVAPRFGFDVDVLIWYLVSLGVWVPVLILWAKYAR